MLEIKGLTKDYGSNRALDGFSFTFKEGICALLGPNGSGKSTLMNLLTDNIKRTSGEILYNGIDILDSGRDYRSIVGYMPQNAGIYPTFTCEEYMLYIAALKGLETAEAEKQTDALLETVELRDVKRSKTRTLSGGMKQRLLLAQAFADTDPTDFAFQMTEAEQVGADGVALFSLGSITPKNYQHQIENGAFRAPSVQCDKGLESYIAQMDYISAKVNNILPICDSFSDGKEKELLDIIASLKDEAKGLEGTVKELRNLVKDTESKIAEIKNIFGEGDDIKAIIGDIEDAVYWTSLYADRMATR